MWHPKYWKRVHLVKEMLADYPPYRPPHNANQVFLSPREGESNMLYFFEQKSMRLKYLYQFLAKFGVEGDLDDRGLAAVSEWLPQYGGLLVNHLRSLPTMWAFYDFACPWTGAFHGLNAIFDLGIYFGECVIARNRRLRWDVRVYDPPHRRPVGRTQPILTGSGFNIEGLKSGRGALDPILDIRGTCGNIAVAYRWRFLVPPPSLKSGDRNPNTFSRRVHQYATS